MRRLALVSDPALSTLRSYTADDTARALTAAGLVFDRLDLAGLAALDRSRYDAAVIPYVDGELDLAPLLQFHRQGGGLLFLGDLPHTGRAFPYRNFQSPELRLTRCRDVVKIQGLTPKGRELLGDLPGLDRMLNQPMSGLRVSCYPPDDCHFLLEARNGFKQLCPVVFIDRKHPDFLGARLAVVGFDGGEPRENVMGVCNRNWSFNPGLLTRDWEGAHTLVARLASAVCPPDVALALDFDPVPVAGSATPVTVRARNLGAEKVQGHIRLSTPAHEAGFAHEGRVEIAPGKTITLAPVAAPCPAGPLTLHAAWDAEPLVESADATRTRFACLHEPPPLSFGFSTFTVFRAPKVEDSYRDFLHHTGRLGMQYVRMALAWEDLEPEPGRFVWDVPDQMLEAAAKEKLPAFFWIFPTARGSGLGEGGVPAWTLREPSIDRDGNPGNFPCIWSPFYREHYFAFLAALTRRYADDPRLVRFVYDFGNSDFPYTYHFYGDRGDLFDYSPHEQAAFANWLAARKLPLEDLARRWGRAFTRYTEVPIPYSEQQAAWLLYDEFRTWGVHQGIKEAVGVIHRIAPHKAPPDFPGHGLGSISDLGTYVHHAQARHWDEVARAPAALTEAHNMGRQWGGEPWQVGGRFPDYDDALFQSVRLQADYLTIPGPDLGVWEDDIARVAMIRRSLAGAKRAAPAIAIMDRMSWNDWTSLAQAGARLDQAVDLVSRTCRYDYSEYRLFVLPPDEVIATARGPSSLLPLDDDYYERILAAVRQGLRVLLFPRTGLGDPLNPLRRVWNLAGAFADDRRAREVVFPETWGGGRTQGHACSIPARLGDEVWLADTQGQPLTVFRPAGKGGFILAGYDSQEDSLDHGFRHDRSAAVADHTLARLLQHLGIEPGHLRTGQACCYKEYLTTATGAALLFYSHQEKPLPLTVDFKTPAPTTALFELARGERIEVTAAPRAGWLRFSTLLQPNRGYYFHTAT